MRQNHPVRIFIDPAMWPDSKRCKSIFDKVKELRDAGHDIRCVMSASTLAAKTRVLFPELALAPSVLNAETPAGAANVEPPYRTPHQPEFQRVLAEAQANGALEVVSFPGSREGNYSIARQVADKILATLGPRHYASQREVLQALIETCHPPERATDRADEKKAPPPLEPDADLLARQEILETRRSGWNAIKAALAGKDALLSATHVQKCMEWIDRQIGASAPPPPEKAAPPANGTSKEEKRNRIIEQNATRVSDAEKLIERIVKTQNGELPAHFLLEHGIVDKTSPNGPLVTPALVQAIYDMKEFEPLWRDTNKPATIPLNTYAVREISETTNALLSGSPETDCVIVTSEEGAFYNAVRSGLCHRLSMQDIMNTDHWDATNINLRKTPLKSVLLVENLQKLDERLALCAEKGDMGEQMPAQKAVNGKVGISDPVNAAPREAPPMEPRHVRGLHSALTAAESHVAQLNGPMRDVQSRLRKVHTHFTDIVTSSGHAKLLEPETEPTFFDPIHMGM